MWGRAEDSYSAREDTERKAVENYRALVRDLYRARADLGMSLRRLGDAAGVATSGVAALESGSAWPRLKTMRAVAHALGLELHVGGDPDVAGHLVRHVRRDPRLKMRYVAYGAGVDRNTFRELRDHARSPSMRTILAVAAELHLTVALRPAASEPTSQ